MTVARRRKKIVPEPSQEVTRADNAPGVRPPNDPMVYKTPGEKDSMSELAGHSFDPLSFGYAVYPGRKKRKRGGITGFGI